MSILLSIEQIQTAISNSRQLLHMRKDTLHLTLLFQTTSQWTPETKMIAVKHLLYTGTDIIIDDVDGRSAAWHLLSDIYGGQCRARH